MNAKSLSGVSGTLPSFRDQRIHFMFTKNESWDAYGVNGLIFSIKYWMSNISINFKSND